MKVQVMEDVWEYSNDLLGIDHLFNKVDDLLDDSEYHISYIVVDGMEVYEDFKDYLSEHIGSVMNVQVIVQTIQEMSDNLLISTESYLENALPEVEELYKQFYQGPTQDSWNKLVLLFEGLQWLFHLTELIEKNRPDLEDWEQCVNHIQKLKDSLGGMEEAMKSNDTIFIGDNLFYETLSSLKGFQANVKRIIDHKVVRPDVN
jgi:hypothetical protein